MILGVLVGSLAGCTGSGDASDRAQARPDTERLVSPTSDGGGPRPEQDAERTLKELLAAEAAGDHRRSYELLSASGRRSYPRVDEWTRVREQLPAITNFEVTGKDGATVVALVGHEPALDSFVGLSPAREHQRWTARREDGRWTFDADPAVEPIYPRDTEAVAAALAWAKAVQRCDEAEARTLEAVEELFGDAAAAAGLCGSKDALEAGTATRVQSGPVSSDLVAQFGADALEWARAVSVRRPGDDFVVTLAPIGESWLVLGVSDI